VRQPLGLATAIHVGHVAHRRFEPIEHGFRYRIFMPLFDLDELPELLDHIPLWSARRPAPARFRRSDYLGDPATPLADAARDLVATRTGDRPGGPVRVLTNPRYWGVGFNPVSFYFLHGAGVEQRVEAMIAEVTNTPWGERRSYVLGAGDGGFTGNFEKLLHVSPFMPMEQSYEWRASEPGERISVSIRSHEDERRVFEASLHLRRREITPRTMSRLLFSYPPMTLATIARIYGHAIALKLKGAPYFSNPGDTGEAPR
jgi:DUF1365 family protein